MKHLSRLLFFLLLLPAAAVAQQGYIHGNGDPRVTGTDCGRSRFYIDDTTSVMYVAGPGSPCVWTPAGSGAYPGVTADGSKGLAVTGTVTAGATVQGATLNLTDGSCTAGTYAKGDNSGCGTPSTGGGVAGVIYASAFGVKADGQIISDAGITSGSTTVTCPNSDCHFTSADIGKVAFGTNATHDVSALSSTVILPRGTITAVTNPSTITVSIAATGSANPGTFVYGTLDSAAYGATQSTGNDPLFAAWTAAADACMPLQLPGGIMLVEHAEFNTYGNVECAKYNAELSNRRGFIIRGFGPSATIIVPTPSLPATACTGPNGTGNGCFFSVPSLYASDLQVWGAGNSAIGSGFNGKVGIYVVPMPFNGGGNFKFQNVYLMSWGAATSGFQGMNIGEHVSGGISGGWIDHLMLEAFGYTSFVMDGNSTPSPVWMANSIVSECVLCVDLKSGILYSNTDLFGGGTSASVDSVLVESGTQFYSTNDSFFYQMTPGASLLRADGATTIVNLTNGVVDGSVIAGTFGIMVTNNASVSLSNTSVKANPAQQALYAAQGGFNDLGGNTISGAEAVPGAGFFKAVPKIVGHGQITLYTGSIASGTAQAITPGAVNSLAVATVTPQSIIDVTPAVSPESVTGYAASASGSLDWKAYPTAGYINFDVRNQTAGAIVPGPMTLNWSVYNTAFDALMGYGCGSSYSVTDTFGQVPALSANPTFAPFSNCYTQPVSTSSNSPVRVNTSHAAYVASGSGFVIYTGAGLFPAAQSSYVVVGTTPANYSGPSVRMTTNGNGYVWYPFTSKIWAVFNGSGSSPGGALSPASCPAVTAGQEIALSVSGNVITCKNVTTSATYSYTDTANTFTTGYPGMAISNPDTITAFYTTAP